MQQDMQLAIYHVPGQLSQYNNHTTGWMVSLTGRARNFSLFQSIKPSYGVLPASCSTGTRH
jgi:hypothetical protein